MDNIVLSYQDIKNKIRGELNRVAESFVEIGYRLKQVRDEELYKVDGYNNINEFAKAEYSLSQSTTSRFIAINDKYSVDGSSPKLLEQYDGYGYSKLSEMLTLSEDELRHVTIQTTRAEIREIKQAKKEYEEAEIYAPAHNDESLVNTQSESDFESKNKFIIPDADKLLIEFFRDKNKRQVMKELAAVISSVWNNEQEAKVSEIINPSGYLFFKKGMVIITFEEKTIKYSKFGGLSTEFTYENFIKDLILIFDFTDKDPWVAFYGEPEPEPEPPKKEPEKSVNKQISNMDKKHITGKPIDKQPVKPNITQSNEDKGTTEQKEQSEVLPGQKNIDEYPEFKPIENSVNEESNIENSNSDTVETIEADIVENVKQDDFNDNGRLLYSNDNVEIDLYETGELNIIIRNNTDRYIKKIKAIDADTGNIWEVAIE